MQLARIVPFTWVPSSYWQAKITELSPRSKAAHLPTHPALPHQAVSKVDVQYHLKIPFKCTILGFLQCKSHAHFNTKKKFDKNLLPFFFVFGYYSFLRVKCFPTHSFPLIPRSCTIKYSDRQHQHTGPIPQTQVCNFCLLHWVFQ